MEVRPNVAQRVVAVVALGAVLWFVGSYLTSATSFTGWTGYAPLQAAFPAHDRLSSVGNLFVWIALVIGWFIVSVFLLRSRAHTGRRGAVRQGGTSGAVGADGEAGGS